jgi:SAM-dependent methyltransferase/uncharacterized protein YbaR (Trm112 family)
MKVRLLQFLACPSCGGDVSLRAFQKDSRGKEVVEGVIGCGKCKRRYPVINGIPRMLPGSMIRKGLMDYFTSKYGEKVLETGEAEHSRSQRIKKKTSESFGFQWNEFSEIHERYEESFLEYIRPLKPSFFRGKLVLDAGCGFGRHSYYAGKYGAEVVGLDLSAAVDAAYRNTRKFEKVHIVQGDIYNLPLKRKFDFIMSIGVLHHLPRPKKGFLNLVRHMRKGTPIFIWLYGREERWFKIHVVEGIIRRVTVRTPHRMLYYLCYLPAVLYHFLDAVHNLLSRSEKTAGVARRMPFRGYEKTSLRIKHADAFDLLATPINNYYTKGQVEEWLRDAGLKKTWVTSIRGKSWRAYGEK